MLRCYPFQQSNGRFYLSGQITINKLINKISQSSTSQISNEEFRTTKDN